METFGFSLRLIWKVAVFAFLVTINVVNIILQVVFGILGFAAALMARE